jgi:hypothetical protein
MKRGFVLVLLLMAGMLKGQRYTALTAHPNSLKNN